MEARAALMALQRGDPIAAVSEPALDVEVVDAWIREGYLVEALHLLASGELGGPAEEWANLLGELLAPVPAHAEEAFVRMHRELLSGGASVALALLEDRHRHAVPFPAWAQRRLELLRWMLLDNAKSAADFERPSEIEPATPLAHALRQPFEERSLRKMYAAAVELAAERPDDRDAAELVRMLELLLEEVDARIGAVDTASAHTVPVIGRPAAAMQLSMGNLDGAASIYRKLVTSRPGDPEPPQLLNAVVGVKRALEGLPLVDRSFRPPADRAFGDDEDETRVAMAKEQRAALEALRAADPAAVRPGTDFAEEETRVALDGEQQAALDALREARQVATEGAREPSPTAERERPDESTAVSIDVESLARSPVAVGGGFDDETVSGQHDVGALDAGDELGDLEAEPTQVTAGIAAQVKDTDLDAAAEAFATSFGSDLAAPPTVVQEGPVATPTEEALAAVDTRVTSAPEPPDPAPIPESQTGRVVGEGEGVVVVREITRVGDDA